jgi:hypothetical protein
MEKLTKLEILDNFSRKFGNDQELGKKYREFVLASEGKLDELTKNKPNDFELGKEIRKILRNNLTN